MGGFPVLSGLLIGCCDRDPDVLRLLEESLSNAGHRTVLAQTGVEAMSAFKCSRSFDALVLDTGLPDIDGRDLCRGLRANGQLAPVMFLSTVRDSHEVVQGFAAGGLAYLVKPFAVLELLARVESLVRRTRLPRSPEMGASGVRIDPSRHALVFGERARTLTPTEFRIVAELLANPGALVSRTDLIDAGWFPGARVNQNALDTYLYRIRRHLDEVGSGATIKTLRGVGHILIREPDTALE